MIPFRKSASLPMGPSRTGAALVMVMICLLLVATISAVLVRMALLQREQLERDEWRSQAEWLANSAQERVAARLADDADYAGETWLPTADGGGAPIGRVEISINPATGDGEQQIPQVRVAVSVPDAPIHRARVVRTWSVSSSETSSESTAASVDP